MNDHNVVEEIVEGAVLELKCTISQKPTGNRLTDAQLFAFDTVRHLYDEQDPTRIETFHSRANEIVDWFDASHRTTLVDTLVEYGTRIGASPLQLRTAERLRDPQSVAVVTGQQAGLLTGPFLSISKAMTAIGLAAQLETELGRPVVPIFWVASEDHDFAEVDHAYCINHAHDVTRIPLHHQFDNHQMVYHQILSEDQVQAVIDSLHHQIPELPYKTELLKTVRATFSSGDTLSVWFARLFAHLLQEHPIVILDPCLPALRQLVRPVFARTLAQFEEVQRGLERAYTEVERLGYAAAVIRDDTNSTVFRVIHGRRYVIERHGHAFRTRGHHEEWSEENLVQLAEQDGTLFSSNVLLRPVIQDHLIPTLAYVGGPAEIAYHALSRAVFQVHQRKLPPLVMRQRFRIATPAVHRTMMAWNLSMDDVSSPTDLVRNHLLHDVSTDLEQQVASMKTDWSRSLEGLANTYRGFGPQVEDIVARQQEQLTGVLAKLERKIYALAMRRKHDDVQQLQRIERWFWTDGHEQERRLSPVNVWAELGQMWFNQLPAWGNYRQPGPYLDLIVE